MTPDDPRHGRNSGYYAHHTAGQDACEPCHQAWLRHRRLRDKKKAMGIPPQLPIGDLIYARLRTARDRGMTHQEIGAAIGVSSSCAWAYVEHGPNYIVLAKTWRKLAAFRPGQILTPTGMIRRIQALHHQGWSCASLAREIGCHEESLQEALRHREYSTKRLQVAVAEAYDRLWDKPCQEHPRITNRARGRARRANWPPAMAWDDDAIDDPRARPAGLIGSYSQAAGIDESAIERRILGDRTAKLHKGETAEVVRRMLADGWSQNGIRRHTGIKPDRYIDPALKRTRQSVAA
jgi:hypothetical protein